MDQHSPIPCLLNTGSNTADLLHGGSNGKRLSPSKCESDQRSSIETMKGNVLILTEDLSLVFSLRHNLMQNGYDLTWTNNFWLALSYLHENIFDALVFDLKVSTVEERFVPHFLEEYDLSSRGKRIFLASSSSSAALRRQMAKQRDVIFSTRHSVPDLVEALELTSNSSSTKHWL